MATEVEALRMFALLTLEEASNAMANHKARANGGQHAGVARMPFSIANSIVRDARALGLRLNYPEDGCQPEVQFKPEGFTGD